MRGVQRSSWWLAVVALALSACASVGAYTDAPRVSLVGLKPIDIRLLEQRFQARLRVQNPNAEVLRIRGMDYTIEVNDETFAQGVSAVPVTVPAFGEEVVEVEVTSTLVTLFEQIRALDEAGEPRLRYRLSGSIALDGVLGKVPFSYEDELNLGPKRRGSTRPSRPKGSI